MELLKDLDQALSGKKGKGIVSISVLGNDEKALSQFHNILPHKREFIVGILPQYIENNVITGSKSKETPSYIFSQPLCFHKVDFGPLGLQLRAFAIFDPGFEQPRVIATNILPSRLDDSGVVRLYAQRHPKFKDTMLNFHAQPNAASASLSSQEYLKSYAGGLLLGRPFSDQEWQAAQGQKAFAQYNDTIWRIEVDLPADAAGAKALAQAACQINALYLKDENSRPIWIISH